MSSPAGTVDPTKKQPKPPSKSLETVGLVLGILAFTLTIAGVYKRVTAKTEKGKEPSLILSIATLICGVGHSAIGIYVYIQGNIARVHA